ncbi:hypothetical protein NUW54_g14087 [Trametes sanguinea]|uniref:Uncharacterized protein n=1 Tax=Trametes sanguinea TaxID=158606 RepID=A0ACC1MGY4_9APHY|nr:hypothetical protein NUW54_g14087 [Trametes sanguinea]
MPATAARIAAKGQHAIDSTVLWMKQTISNTCGTMALFHALIARDLYVAHNLKASIQFSMIALCGGPRPDADSALHKHRPGYNVKDNIYPAYDDLNIVALKPHGRERTLDE